jgi:membrane associated rhomboid family serine protease
MVGNSLELVWGKKKFLFFYFSSGIGAGLVLTLINYLQFNSVYEQLISMGISANDIQRILDTGQYNDAIISLTNSEMSKFYNFYHSAGVGASGALFGILAASAIMFPNAIIHLFFLPIPFKNKYFILTLILSDLFLGVFSFSGDNIARFAHVGGAIIGGAIAWYWKEK